MSFSMESSFKSICEYKSFMGDIKHKIGRIKIDKDRYFVKTTQLREELDDTSEELRSVRKTMNECEEKMIDMQEANHNLQIQLQKAQQENCACCEKICFLEAESDDLRNKSVSMEHELKSKEGELTKLKESFATCSAERKSFAENLSRKDKDLEKERMCNMTSLDAFKHKQEELSGRLSESENNVTQLSGLVEQYQQENVEKSNEINFLREEMEKLSEKTSKLQVKKNKYKVAAAKSEELCIAVEKKLERLGVVNEKCRDLENNVIQLNADVSKLNEENKRLEVELDTKMKENEELKQQNTTFQNIEDKLNKTHVELNQSIGGLESDNIEKEATIKRLEVEGVKNAMIYETSHKKLLRIIRKLEQDLEMTRSELKQRRQLTNELQEQALQKDFHVQEMERQLKEHRIKLEVKHKEEEIWKDKNKTLVEELKTASIKDERKSKQIEEERMKHEVCESTNMLKILNELRYKKDELRRKHDNTTQQEEILTLNNQIKDHDNQLRYVQESNKISEEIARMRLARQKR